MQSITTVLLTRFDRAYGIRRGKVKDRTRTDKMGLIYDKTNAFYGGIYWQGFPCREIVARKVGMEYDRTYFLGLFKQAEQV